MRSTVRNVILLFSCLSVWVCTAFITLSRPENSRLVLSRRKQSCENSSNDKEDGDIQPICPSDNTRRQLLISNTVAGASWLSFLQPGWSADSSSFSLPASSATDLDAGLLESRVTENVLSPPSYGLEDPDVFYPSWFLGTWKVSSVTTDVQAPCGLTLFGGNRTYQAAVDEIGTSLLYEGRFISADGGRAIADREFNVRSIAKAAMGVNSVVDIPLATPNKFSCVLVPQGSPSMLKVDLIVLNRRQEQISDEKFHCSEVVREIVSPIGEQQQRQSRQQQRPAILKEVETTSLYTYVSSSATSPPETILCKQRSATFLLPSQDNPMAMKMWEYSRGRPIDVRFYDVTYTKKS